MPITEKEEKDRKSRRNERIALMVIIMLCSIIMMSLAGSLPWDFAKSGLQKLGEALFIAAALGLTIDYWMKRQIAEDVFEASIGYMLPPELRGEMRWIYGFKTLCEQHIHYIEITKIGEELVDVISKIERHIKNFSDQNVKFTPAVNVDEWGYSGHPSQITRVGYKYRSIDSDSLTPPEYEYHSNSTISRKFPEIELKPGEIIHVWYEAKETKHINDFAIWQYSTPTMNPEVTINISEDTFGYGMGMGRSSEDFKRDKLKNTYRYSGTLLPTQRIEVRWWPKSKTK